MTYDVQQLKINRIFIPSFLLFVPLWMPEIPLGRLNLNDLIDIFWTSTQRSGPVCAQVRPESFTRCRSSDKTGSLWATKHIKQ